MDTCGVYTRTAPVWRGRQVMACTGTAHTSVTSSVVPVQAQYDVSSGTGTGTRDVISGTGADRRAVVGWRAASGRGRESAADWAESAADILSGRGGCQSRAEAAATSESSRFLAVSPDVQRLITTDSPPPREIAIAHTFTHTRTYIPSHIAEGMLLVQK